MLIHFSVVGRTEPYNDVRVMMDCAPQEGETVELPGLEAALTNVRTVVWYPLGDPEDETTNTEPFVYVVLGPRRPE
jgi:hypothetical protein